MSSGQPTTEQNLLFGVLALRLNFLGKDALLRALSAWALDNTTSLGQILVSQGAIDGDTLAVVEALVQKHLTPHDDNRATGLETVGTLDAAQVPGKELHATLTTLTSQQADRQSSVTGATCLPEVRPSSTAPRFRILRPRARGGLGEVFVASDEELHREVALKQLQDRHADHPESRARFLREGEVTGRLEHPGIVPVYGLGQYLDGRPYYAMRLIEGDSLKGAIEQFYAADGPERDLTERAMAFRRLLRRFVDVCNAVSYAHSRGVVHRDLKPDNIMLGPYGETLVVDWGLAKVIGQREDLSLPNARAPVFTSNQNGDTVPGSLLGTPAYMSPEQARGQSDEVGPASDVYSLGATLYSVLTGRAPFAEPDLDSTLQKVQQGDFPPPKDVNPAIHVGLQSICLRAMAVQPQDRYASPADLANDIEGWLADEPFLGYVDTIFRISPDGRFVSMSPGFEALYGWSREEWLGKHFAPMIHPDDLPLCMSLHQEALRGKTPPVFHARILRKSGDYLTVEVVCMLQIENGQVIGILGMTRRVSEVHL